MVASDIWYHLIIASRQKDDASPRVLVLLCSIQLKSVCSARVITVRYEPRSWFGSRELVAIQTACHMQSQTFFSVATRDEALQTSYANSEESFPCTSSPEKVIIIIIARHKNTKTQKNAETSLVVTSLPSFSTQQWAGPYAGNIWQWALVPEYHNPRVRAGHAVIFPSQFPHTHTQIRHIILYLFSPQRNSTFDVCRSALPEPRRCSPRVFVPAAARIGERSLECGFVTFRACVYRMECPEVR